MPALHIRPDHGWLNDPNGMVHHGGRWHVFFQHNPQRPVHERIAWGHVSSADLVGWDPHPVAFAPEPGGPDRAGCWSGVFLPWLDRPAMAYSGVVDDTHASTVVVREALDDDLDTWAPPYVVATTPPTSPRCVTRSASSGRGDGSRCWVRASAARPRGAAVQLRRPA
ncbi:glycoside hydrolase family 32 protein [Barrientosiimonas endolithica]|uniref:glycoside hydrolase family 32 protein n=1 Tax=Barrientosiimonas endolithica TaxID=1535208 RepID=UPI00259B84C7|nr:glycoside hydrolase family 32 protein [Barrientosiimonas endolithica]